MPSTHKIVVSIVIVLLAVMLVGEAMVYVASPYEYKSGMDGNEYSVYSSVSGDFSIVQYDNPSGLEKIYVFYDGDYSSPAGVDKDEVKEFLRELSLRGVQAQTIDAQEIADLISSTADASRIALVFTDGGLPDTVYSGSAGDLIFTWFDNGGNIFWSGPTIGKYITTTDKSVEVGDVRYTLFFPEGVLGEDNEEKIATIPNDGLGKALCIRSSDCRYGIRESYTDTQSLGYVSEDGYCAAAVTEFGNGQLLIIGNNFGDNTRTDMAQILASDISEESVMLCQKSVSCHGNTKKGSVDDIAGTGVYIFCGGDYTCYGKSYTI